MSSTTPPTGNSRRFALVAPSAEAAIRLRGSFLAAVKSQGHAVLCLTPSPTAAQSAAIEALGATSLAIDLRPPGLEFFAHRKALAALEQIFRQWRPDAVMGFGARALPLAVHAARRAGVKRIVSLINGLPEHDIGGVSGEDSMSARTIAGALRASHAAVVHNGDDARRLARRGVMPKDMPVKVVAGAGVDLDQYAVQPLPALGNGLVFLMIARLERPRGVGEFATAARQVKVRSPAARFLLAGPEGRGADAISLTALGAGDGAFEYLGPLDDVRPALAAAHVYVYPSRAEGMPRSVLEALAIGRPVITTSAPGCRETVDERINGCIVPPGDAPALAEAMESFLERPDLIPAMARASRVKAERRFDAREVNKVLMDVLGLN